MLSHLEELSDPLLEEEQVDLLNRIRNVLKVEKLKLAEKIEKKDLDREANKEKEKIPKKVKISNNFVRITIAM